MSTFKSTVILAVLAMFLCLSSAVAAADLYSPGSPVNCTAWIGNCKALTISTYGNGKNTSYTGPSAQCNVTNLSGAQPLCGQNVICLATFINKNETPTTGGGNGTTGGNSTTGGTPKMYTVTSMDMTKQLMDLYDSSKCSAAVMKIATSLGALITIGSIVTFFNYIL